MVSPVDCDEWDEWLYEAVYSVLGRIRPSAIRKIDDCQTLAMVRRETAFRTKLRSNPKYGNAFITQTNAFFYQEEPPSKWKWKNTSNTIRDEIIRGLKNRGELVIRQKKKLMKQIYLVEKEVDRSRILEKCNSELEYVWSLLDAFSSLDEGIKKLCERVDFVWYIDPHLGKVADHGENPAAAA